MDYECFSASPAKPRMSRSSYLDGSQDGRQVAVKLPFCEVLFPRFVKNGMQYPYVILISFFI